MAQEFPTPKELADARSALDAAEKAYAEVIAAQSTIGDPIYKGVVYSRNKPAELKKLQAIADRLRAAEKTAKANLETVEKPVKEAQKKSTELGRKIRVLPGEKAPVGPSKVAAEKAALDKKIADVNIAPSPGADKPSTETKTVTETKTAAPKEVTSAADVRMAEQASSGPAPTAPSTASTTEGGGVSTGGTRTGRGKPKGAPETPTVGQRYTGPKGATFEWDGKKWNRIVEQEWASIVQQEFGPLWDVYNSNADVKTVLDKSVKEGWFDDETKLTESLRSTGWFRTTERSARNFAIRQSTDPAQIEDEIVTKIEDIRGSASANALSFDETTLRKLATDSIKYGWSSQQQLNALGSEAVAQARAGGARGVADLRSGFVGQELRKTASSYAQKVDDALLDSWVTDIMTGKKTQEQWTELMRSTAATQFRSLQPALDKGQDVATSMYAYKQQASRILGEVMDTTDIDWTDSKWNPALNYRDPKTNEYRQMDLWEWNQYLRGMPEWKNTTEAKNVYGNIAMSLQNAFSTKGTGGATQ